MQLTNFTDYGLRALIYIASLPEEEMTNITKIAEVYGVSRNHMVKIVSQLSHAGFVYAVRGKNGGLRLGKPAEQIRLGEVVRAIESLTLVDCYVCHITSACRLKSIFSDAINAFLRELDKYTLADIVEQNLPLRQLLTVAATR